MSPNDLYRMIPAWGDVTIRQVTPGTWNATAIRNLDDVLFASSGVSPDEARAKLDAWLDAPIKSESQSIRDYLFSDEYLKFLEGVAP